MKEIVRGASVAFSLKVVAAGLQFAFSVVVTRTLGAKGAGVFFLSLTVLTIASVLGRVGLDNTLLRFTATSAAGEDWNAIKGLYRKGISLALIASSTFAILVWAVAPILSVHIFSDPALILPLRWISLAIVPHALFFLHAELLKGLKRIPLALFIQSVSLPLFALASTPLLARLAGVNGVVWAYIGSSLLTFIASYYLWIHEIPQWGDRKGKFLLKDILSSNIPLFVVSIMNLLIVWMPTIFLGIYGSTADVGIFSAAQRTATLVSFILIAFNSIVAPKFALLYKQRDLNGLRKTVRNSTKLITFVAFPILLFFLISPEWIMGIFGHEFQKGGILLRIMALGQFVNVASGSVGYLIMMTGNEVLARNILILSGFLSIILCCLLIPKFNDIGAAISVSLTLSFTNFAFVAVAWKKLRIRIY